MEKWIDKCRLEPPRMCSTARPWNEGCAAEHAPHKVLEKVTGALKVRFLPYGKLLPPPTAPHRTSALSCTELGDAGNPSSTRPTPHRAPSAVLVTSLDEMDDCAAKGWERDNFAAKGTLLVSPIGPLSTPAGRLSCERVRKLEAETGVEEMRSAAAEERNILTASNSCSMSNKKTIIDMQTDGVRLPATPADCLLSSDCLSLPA